MNAFSSRRAFVAFVPALMRAFVPVFALATTLLLVPQRSHAIEEPAYEVVQTLPERGAGAGSADATIEIRQYAPYVVAEVVMEASFERAGNQAFPLLAGYIFGKNKGERKFAMTAPVTQAPEPATPVKLAMTAPVIQQPDASGAPANAGVRPHRVQFVLPRTVTLATAPEPLDPRVQLRQVPAARWAVIRYSGTWSQANHDEHLARLRAALEQAGIATQGEPLLARYNGPMTPWFLRRNEVWLAVK
jgi:hypothetical protein